MHTRQPVIGEVYFFFFYCAEALGAFREEGHAASDTAVCLTALVIFNVQVSKPPILVHTVSVYRFSRCADHTYTHQAAPNPALARAIRLHKGLELPP